LIWCSRLFDFESVIIICKTQSPNTEKVTVEDPETNGLERDGERELVQRRNARRRVHAESGTCLGRVPSPTDRSIERTITTHDATLNIVTANCTGASSTGRTRSETEAEVGQVDRQRQRRGARSHRLQRVQQRRERRLHAPNVRCG
jgi:hypothetical protein